MEIPQRLVEFVHGSDPSVSLGEALLHLACSRPDSATDVARSMGTFDDLATLVVGGGAAAVTRAVFGQAGFRGDETDYHDPRNSLLDQVLHRRMGMPITLAVVLIETGVRCGVPLEPIAAPGHFLVRDPASGDYLDPFSAGARLDPVRVETMMRDRAPSEAVAQAMLRPATGAAIVSRVLNNLQYSYAARTPRALDWLLDTRLALPSSVQGDPLTLARLCEQRGRFDAAADRYEEHAARSGDQRLLARSRDLRARAN